MKSEVLLYVGEALGKYGFPHGHPFGPDRQDAFWKEAVKQGLVIWDIQRETEGSAEVNRLLLERVTSCS